MESFDVWWTRMYSKLPVDQKEIARAAFEAAKAQSRNYFADDDTFPEQVTFCNGRVVSIQDNPEPGVHHGVYLSVNQLPD
jgi:hypothetical protein